MALVSFGSAAVRSGVSTSGAMPALRHFSGSPSIGSGAPSTAVMIELAQIVTTGKGPSADPDKLAKLRKDNPLAVYNPAWDARRLWLTSYLEGQRTVRIEGLARDGTARAFLISS